ncbi:MAG: TrkA family potassium uptake protein [Cyanobacteria bacterium J06627_28]
MRIILVGTDKLIYFLGRRFVTKGDFVTIITPEQLEATSLSRRLKATVIVGDGSDPAVLQEAGAYQADALLALTDQDQDNLIACQIAQDRYGVPRTVAIVNDPDNREIFESLGISLAFSATEILGSLIEQQTVPSEIKNLVPVTESDVVITEVVLKVGSPSIGKAIKDLGLRGATVACVVRRGHVLKANRRMYLMEGDRILLISEDARYGQAQQALTGEGL